MTDSWKTKLRKKNRAIQSNPSVMGDVFLEYLIMQKFKHFQEGERVNFKSPITVLTGTNGTGKSSILHCAYSSYYGTSMTRFWLTTDLDQVDLESKFAYKVSGSDEGVYAREGIQKGLDYWEQKKIKGKRPQRLKRDIIYVTFMDLIPGFYAYKHFLNRGHKNPPRYLKMASRKIYTDLTQADIVRPASQEILEKVKYVTGLDYNSINSYRHKHIRNVELTSHIFGQNALSYSDAASGSGEFSIVRLCTEILNAPNNALILLDEPENTLHPYAQRKLIEFLTEESLRKNLQVIISSHSDHIIEDLPSACIKVFKHNEHKKIHVVEDVEPEYAFYTVTNIKKEKIKLIVEDDESKILLQCILDTDAQLPFMCGIETHNSAKSILKKSSFWSQGNYRSLIFLDGDQRESVKPSELSNIAVTSTYEGKKQAAARSLGYTETRNVNQIFEDIDQAPNREQRLSSIISYWNKSIKFLPGEHSPEKLILEYLKSDLQNYKNRICALDPSVKSGEFEALILDVNKPEKITFSELNSMLTVDLFKLGVKDWVASNDEAVTAILASIKEALEER
jgi:predicted ATPase